VSKIVQSIWICILRSSHIVSDEPDVAGSTGKEEEHEVHNEDLGLVEA
jgi:hypothetical protein